MSEYPDRLEGQRRIRPLDPAAVRRRSHVSQSWHDYDGSVSASTRSWVQSTQQNPPPPPEHLPPPSAALGLRAVNPDENEVEDFSEYMTIRQETLPIYLIIQTHLGLLPAAITNCMLSTPRPLKQRNVS